MFQNKLSLIYLINLVSSLDVGIWHGCLLVRLESIEVNTNVSWVQWIKELHQDQVDLRISTSRTNELIFERWTQRCHGVVKTIC